MHFERVRCWGAIGVVECVGITDDRWHKRKQFVAIGDRTAPLEITLTICCEGITTGVGKERPPG